MIASLPMYWRDETAELWHVFWQHVQQHADLPDLTPPEELPPDWTDHWLLPDLALSATCSLPFRTSLRNKVTYVGTLWFGLDCKPGHYFSHFIETKQPFTAPPRLAINRPDSQSGWGVAVEDGIDVSDIIVTGSHAASLTAVATGAADVAYIDAVTWRLLERADHRTQNVRITGRSALSPALPLITSKGRDPAPLREAVSAACDSFALDDPCAIGGPLSFVLLDEADYLALPTPPTPQTYKRMR